MANEVKRWEPCLKDSPAGTFVTVRQTRRVRDVFVKVEDHERIVASLKAQLSMTNSNWPHEKKLHEIIAEQKRVIEKLRISMATALELESCGETSCPIPMRAMCSTPSHKELRKTLLEITAIEQKGEGT